MRKYIWTAVVCVVIFTVSFGITGILQVSQRRENAGTALQEAGLPAEQPDVVIPAQLATGENQYVVRVYDGAVSVFAAAEEVPMIITEISVDGLRSADRQLLQQGITLESYEDVLMLLEDLGS